MKVGGLRLTFEDVIFNTFKVAFYFTILLLLYFRRTTALLTEPTNRLTQN